MTAAIYFQADAYSTTGPKLMGRHAAGETFLRAFLSCASTSEFWAQVEKREDAQLFTVAVQKAGRREPIKFVERANLGALGHPGTLYVPEPGIGAHAWRRAAFGHSCWSLCGITHTTASTVAMDSLVDLLVAPVQPWDAVICTSSAVKDNVQRVLQAQAAYLSHRLGAQRSVLPQLPVIPLGVHTKDFVFSAEQKMAARHAVQADTRTHVVLFMGRLSFHAKAHPLALYQAVELVAGRLPKGEKLLLIECGWHANDAIASAYTEAEKVACPSVRVIRLDGRKAEDRRTAWASADIFCSLSDNIQETFGLVPIEAMAASLPVVVSDWNGYKDTVRDGVDGFRIPTVMPHAGLGGDLAWRHALQIDSYDLYCGHTCSLVAVDVHAAAEALAKLVTSRELRLTMGAAGRRRAVETFEWNRIIPQYEALWTNLAEVRKAHNGTLKMPHYPWPARIDPFGGFASYPTHILRADMVVTLMDPTPDLAVARVEGYRALAMVNFARAILPSPTQVRRIVGALAQGPKTAAALIQPFATEEQPRMFRSLVWLAKLGIVRFES